jgi:acyl-coenzyme A thioesterase PaaI-like protein
MSKARPSPGAQLLAAWRRCAPLPFGRWLFSRLLGCMNRYSGSVGATITTLEPGHATVVLRDRARVRNHLDSIHAVALVNIAEMASGLAMLTGLPPTVRGIPVRITISYAKKARGTLTAECRCAIPTVTSDQEHDVESVVRDAGGDEVARAAVTWRLGPMPEDRGQGTGDRA